MATTTFELGSTGVARRVAETIKEARTLVGWGQRELAARAGVAQATVSRIESGAATSVDLVTAGRLFAALGLRASVAVDDFRLDDRRRQRDGVHAKLNGFSAARHERAAWQTATELLIGNNEPRGWIDLLAFREADRALLVQETKADIPDFGGLQRSVAFYERMAPAVAQRLGWYPESVAVLVVVLDSATVARRLADNRELVRRAFPASIREMSAWLADPECPMPQGWAIGTCDPASRSAEWLRPTTLGSRRSTPAYRDYADAASRLLSDHRRPRSWAADRRLLGR
jgi:transcriptional regulator with XRE-family HTH domain